MRESLPTPIAIDGPAASGKSTVGRTLAERCGYAFLDTGLMYRAFTLEALRRGIDADDLPACEELAATIELGTAVGTDTHVLVAGEDVTGLLRAPEVEANVSLYSVIAAVRERMVSLQRGVATSGPSILAGRDIGTVVLPDAPLKFYLDASEHTRAERRSAQASDWGEAQEHHDARRDIGGRDTIDSARTVSPLRPAEDAIVINTTHMTMAEVIAFVLERVGCATG